MDILVQSFAFTRSKPPTGSNLVFDARVLPDPYYETPHLNHLSGSDEPVIKFLQSQQSVKNFLDNAYNKAVEEVERIRKDDISSNSSCSKFTVSVGCMGGRFRSVYVTEQLAKMLDKHFAGDNVNFKHIHKDTWTP